MAIGKRIEQRLAEKKWSRNDLMARVPNLTPQALSNLIKRDSVRSEWDLQIAEALEVSVLWLVYGMEHAYQPTGKVRQFEVREPALTGNMAKLVEAASELTPEGQLILVGRAQEMAAQYGKAKANHSN